jgi:hypothetical protein
MPRKSYKPEEIVAGRLMLLSEQPSSRCRFYVQAQNLIFAQPIYRDRASWTKSDERIRTGILQGSRRV